MPASEQVLDGDERRRLIATWHRGDLARLPALGVAASALRGAARTADAVQRRARLEPPPVGAELTVTT
ncbi:hypothetical protein [Saccharothrix deserti]|uniref:hypothetical protein n=1 Tax=Saccharothrix deserti TaxID=2593674 RepID=UPI00131C9F93|nr:hypothetical protein [Saccharothrix deserti]